MKTRNTGKQGKKSTSRLIYDIESLLDALENFQFKCETRSMTTKILSDRPFKLASAEKGEKN